MNLVYESQPAHVESSQQMYVYPQNVNQNEPQQMDGYYVKSVDQTADYQLPQSAPYDLNQTNYAYAQDETRNGHVEQSYYGKSADNSNNSFDVTNARHNQSQAGLMNFGGNQYGKGGRNYAEMYDQTDRYLSSTADANETSLLSHQWIRL